MSAKPDDDPVVWIDGESPAFVAAIRQAQATFVRDFAEPLAREWERDEGAKVAAAIVKVFFPDQSDPKRGEHMWVNYQRWTGQWIVGDLTGQPLLPNLKSGQRVRVRLDRLSDWVSVVDGKATGGFTLPLMLASMSEADAALLRTEPPFCWLVQGDRRSVAD